MVPRKKILPDAGKTLAIGWNASKEAAQAVAAVMGNLQKADKVFVLESEIRMATPLNAEKACIYLKCHGVAADSLFRSGNINYFSEGSVLPTA